MNVAVYMYVILDCSTVLDANASAVYLAGSDESFACNKIGKNFILH